MEERLYKVGIRKPLPKLTERDYENAKLEQIEKIRSITRFAGTDGDPEVRKRKAMEDDFYFARTYLKHVFESPTQAEFHKEMAEDMELREVPVLLTASRDHAKSTIAFMKMLKWIIYGQDPFIVYVMDSKDLAEAYTQRVLVELQENPRIIQDFGRLVPATAARGNFETLYREQDPLGNPIECSKSRVIAWGDGMSMRGLISGGTRPSTIICEDLQDRQKAESEQQTKKTINLIKGDYLPALRAKNWRFIVIGNIICANSLIDQGLKTFKGWIKKKFPAIVYDEAGNARAVWPEQWSLERLEKRKQEIGEHHFLVEYMCEAVEVEGVFKLKWFKFYKEDELPSDVDTSRIVVQCDPSWSDVGDNKAMFVMVRFPYSINSKAWGKWKDANGIPMPEGVYDIILQPFNRQCSLDEMIERIYGWNTKWKPQIIAVDGTYSQKVILKREFARAALKYGRLNNLKFTELSTSKKDRILALEPIIQQGYLLFPINDNEDMNTTLMQFTRYDEGKNVKDDGPDAIAAGIDTLNKVHKKAKVNCW